MNNSEYRSVFGIMLLATIAILLILSLICLVFYGAWQGGWLGIFAILVTHSLGRLSK